MCIRGVSLTCRFFTFVGTKEGSVGVVHTGQQQRDRFPASMDACEMSSSRQRRKLGGGQDANLDDLHVIQAQRSHSQLRTSALDLRSRRERCVDELEDLEQEDGRV